MDKSACIKCGKIINTHGCHGALKLESWCDSPEKLASMRRIFVCRGEDAVEYRVIRASVFKQFVIMELDGVGDMDSALALKNTVVYAARADFGLREGEYFIADIIGCDVVDAENGKKYGRLADIINRGASDIYVVDTPSGEVMIPAVDEFIDRVEVGKGVFVRPIPGMFDGDFAES